MAIYGYLWPYMDIWTYMAIYGYMDIYGRIWTYAKDKVILIKFNFDRSGEVKGWNYFVNWPLPCVCTTVNYDSHRTHLQGIRILFWYRICFTTPCRSFKAKNVDTEFSNWIGDGAEAICSECIDMCWAVCQYATHFTGCQKACRWNSSNVI